MLTNEPLTNNAVLKKQEKIISKYNKGKIGTEKITTMTTNVNTCTVVFRGLHTLRLESLKLVIQPLHKFLVNKLQFWQVS